MKKKEKNRFYYFFPFFIVISVSFFLFREKIESILQDTLFQPRPLLEETVTKTMEQVLEIRDEILARTKSIRTGTRLDDY